MLRAVVFTLRRRWQATATSSTMPMHAPVRKAMATHQKIGGKSVATL
jgi:hypothetical protein